MGKMLLTSCHALSTPGKFSNVDRYAITMSMSCASVCQWMSRPMTMLLSVCECLLLVSGNTNRSIINLCLN